MWWWVVVWLWWWVVGWLWSDGFVVVEVMWLLLLLSLCCCCGLMLNLRLFVDVCGTVEVVFVLLFEPH